MSRWAKVHTMAKIGHSAIAITDREIHTAGSISKATKRMSPGTDPPT